MKKVQGSPYAKLVFGLKVRQVLVGLLIPYIMFQIFRMVINVRISGTMGTLNRIFMLGIGMFICYRIYSTIPQAKKQLEYYRKYPHLMNYVPTSAKESIDDIFKTIKKNKEKKE
jgi:hypothetical protein